MTARGTAELLAELDVLGLAAWTATPDTLQLTAVTAAGRELLCLAAGPLPLWPDLVHPDHRAALSTRAATLDQQLRDSQGGWRWVRLELRPLGKELLAVAVGTTDLHEDATRAADAQLEALVDNLPFDYFELDMSGQYVRQNAQAKKMWGDQVGKRLDQVPIPEETRRLWATNNARAYAGEVIREEVEMLVGAEKRRMINVLSPVREAGAIRGIVGLNIDVTERRQAEQQREKLATELKKSLEALDQAQLRLVARERLAALGELAAVVAHEVRNPLGAIFNSLTQIKKQPTPELEEMLLGIITEEASRLDQMVRSLLSFARPFHPHLVPEEMEPILRDALQASLRAQADPCPVTTKLEVAPELGPVPVDSQLLRMALTNVFDNALQAMMPAGGELTVVAAPEARDGKNWVEVQVRDTGRGIHAEVLPRIFEPFFTTRAAGTGLGLAVVRRVVEAHHGAVVALSQPGQGATFAIYLPR
ncbi:MAG: hypothetical protein JST54_27480 [Deltaproteobacteria bacterium]|nr:hypothetical protein [Deltaproteobacteria bacterium]